MPLSKKYTPTGLDLGSRMITLVRFEHLDNGLKQTLNYTMPRRWHDQMPSVQEFGRVARVLARQGVESRRVVLGIPRESVLTGLLELPPVQDQDTMEVIARSEISRIHNLSSSDYEISLWPLPAPARGSETVSVLALVCMHELVDQWIDNAQNAGLTVEAVDVWHSAINRALRLLPGMHDETLVVDIGYESTRLLVTRRGTMIHERLLSSMGSCKVHDCLRISSSRSEEQILRILENPSLAESNIALENTMQKFLSDIADEISKTTHYIQQRFGDPEKRRIIIAGDHTGFFRHQLGGIISSQTGATREQPAASHENSQANPICSLASGLALHNTANTPAFPEPVTSSMP